MIIDSHFHPALIAEISGDKKRFSKRCDEMNFHLMKPSELAVLDVQNRFAGIDKMFLLPQDASADCGEAVISNADICRLVELRPDMFIGFASVDPRQSNAAEMLEQAFGEQKLSGLKLNLCKLKISPRDERLSPLMDICRRHGKPVIFHAGMSWEPDAPAEFGRPLEFERLVQGWPEVNICLSHFGWPWVKETVMLMIKYPNLYTDTAAAYMDSPAQFLDYVFTKEFAGCWLDHNFAEQVMFGSNAPRFRPVRMLRGLNMVQMKERTRKLVLGENALRFVGLEKRNQA